MGELFGLLTRAPDDRLDDRWRWQQYPSPAQFIDHSAGELERLGDGLRNRHRERHDRAKVTPAECGIAETLPDIGEMRAAGFVATHKTVERYRRHVDLIGDPGGEGDRKRRG